MMVFVIIYFIGLVFVGSFFVGFVKTTDEDVSLFDVLRMVYVTLMSWASVLTFIVVAVAILVKDYCSKIIVKKGISFKVAPDGYRDGELVVELKDKKEDEE